MATCPIARAFVLACVLAAEPAGSQSSNPDFDAVAWRPLGCGASPLTATAPRGAVDLVGDATSPAAYMALDATYLYFRYGVDGDPSGTRGFARSSDWNMLVQVPSGNPFQYQYQLSLCRDDDGDGLVDYDDPDCCAERIALDVGRLILRSPSIRGRSNRFRLEAQYAEAPPALFNPLRQDSSVQLADSGGALFCATLPAQHWLRLRRLTYRFSDRTGALGGGLDTGEFRIGRSGTLLFRASGHDIGLRPIDGSAVRLTVRFGNECAQSSMALHAGRKGLVFP